MAYYKIIGGIRYDRSLLEAAESFTKGRGESRISMEEIQALYEQANDGQGITEIERNTLIFISKQFNLTEKARIWLADKVKEHTESLEELIKRVKQTYSLPNLKVNMSAETVQAYQALGGSRNVESVLRGALEAYLHGNQGQLSFSAVISRRDGAYQESPDPTPLLKTYIDQGTLFLIPPDAIGNATLPYDLPYLLDTANFWNFVLQVPDFEPLEFFAFVHRAQALQYNKGQFSKKADLEHTIRAVVQQYAMFPGMKWNIPVEEVARQWAIMPGQNFGNALFSALNTGVFNQESSFSFGDFIRQEIWPDPAIEISAYMRAYANTGVLHLIPLDYRAQTDQGTAAFPVPEQYSFWMDGEWVFGLEMPKKTQVKLILTTQREGNGGDMAWNEGFVDDPQPMSEQLKKVIGTEFNLEGLELRYDEAEFESQRVQFGPDWRKLPALLRQILNTLLNDYLSPNSMFNAVANAKKQDLDPTYFDDPKEYRAAVRYHIENYLRISGTLELLPLKYNPDEPSAFPQGEKVEDFWLARSVAESLADHWFWLAIQRWPDDEQRPYNYID
ncbi:MAG: hypothetical protein WCR52_17355 [Bacteroidota bacterium]